MSTLRKCTPMRCTKCTRGEENEDQGGMAEALKDVTSAQTDQRHAHLMKNQSFLHPRQRRRPVKGTGRRKGIVGAKWSGRRESETSPVG